MHRQRPASTGQHRATIVAPGGSVDSGGTTNRQRPASTGQHRATIVAPGGSTRATTRRTVPGERHERGGMVADGDEASANPGVTRRRDDLTCEES